MFVLASGILATALTTVAQAGVYPPTTAGLELAPLVVRTESGQELDLGLVVAGTPGPVFLIPGYVACHGACPLLARTMRNALRGRVPHRVVFLSFAGDESEMLREFRQREKLPENWTVVSARNQAEAKKFLDRYGYVFEQRRAEFVHPNQAIVLRRNGVWAASLFVRDGLDVTAVSRAFAMADDEAPWTLRGAAVLTDPRSILGLGVVGFVAALSVVVGMLFRQWRRTYDKNYARS